MFLDNLRFVSNGLTQLQFTFESSAAFASRLFLVVDGAVIDL